MPRPSAAERKAEYLRIGAVMVAEFSPEQASAVAVDALANVKVADVAERAGVTKGAVYHIWPTQEAFRIDLLGAVLHRNHQQAQDRVMALVEEASIEGKDPQKALAELTCFLFDTLKDDPGFFARFSFFRYASNPKIRSVLADDQDSVNNDFGPFIDLYLKILHRQFREPFTTAIFLTASGSLLHGLCLRYRISPELTEFPRSHPDTSTSHEETLNMFAFGFKALLDQFTEEIPE